MKIVIDTNIIFSCLLNTSGTIGDLIFNSEEVFEFYSCDYMRFEIRKHWKKLKKISKLTDAELQNSYDKTLAQISFINEELIAPEIWHKAEIALKLIDPDDVDFLALARYLRGGLWTGDKVFYEGLKALKIAKIYNSMDLIRLRNRLMK
ncbi:MAG: PIN domain-containing protein [Ginsengibacter sp.]